MPDPRPIGIRIPRPYDTEADFIRGDGLAIGRAGMILIGAPARPPGITVRFELMLRNGEAVFRGEGRVVAHRVHANGRQGLEIRFTRLDSHSKAVVDKVLLLRRTGALAAGAEAIPGNSRPPAPRDDEQSPASLQLRLTAPPPPPPMAKPGAAPNGGPTTSTEPLPKKVPPAPPARAANVVARVAEPAPLPLKPRPAMPPPRPSAPPPARRVPPDLSAASSALAAAAGPSPSRAPLPEAPPSSDALEPEEDLLEPDDDEELTELPPAVARAAEPAGPAEDDAPQQEAIPEAADDEPTPFAPAVFFGDEQHDEPAEAQPDSVEADPASEPPAAGEPEASQSDSVPPTEPFFAEAPTGALVESSAHEHEHEHDPAISSVLARLRNRSPSFEPSAQREDALERLRTIARAS